VHFVSIAPGSPSRLNRWLDTIEGDTDRLGPVHFNVGLNPHARLTEHPEFKKKSAARWSWESETAVFSLECGHPADRLMPSRPKSIEISLSCVRPSHSMVVSFVRVVRWPTSSIETTGPTEIQSC